MKDNALLLERIYQSLEYDTLIAISKFLNIEDINDIEKWKKVALSKRIQLQQQVIIIINSRKDEITKIVNLYIEEQAKIKIEEIDNDLQPIIIANILEYIKPKKIIDEVIKVTNKTLLETLNKVQAGLLKGADSVYIDIIQNSANQVLLGNSSISKAVSRTINKWADKGIPAIVRKDGVMLSPEGYVSMVIRATQKSIENDLQKKRFDEYGIDLVLISSHLGSRPTHAPFQGRIFSRSGNSDKYPPLEITGYGEIDGLITGINCRHRMYAYYEGITNNPYKTYDLEKNNKRYAETQKQRHLERNIRKAKRRKEMLEKANADEEEIRKADNLIKVRQFKMREFIKETGLTRRRTRENVYD